MYLAFTTSSSSRCRLLRFALHFAAPGPRGGNKASPKAASVLGGSAGCLWGAGASSGPGLPCSAAIRLLGTRPRF